MDAPKAAARLSVAAAVALLGVLVAVSLSEEGRATPSAVLARDGSPLAVAPAVGVTPAHWRGQPVLVVVTTAETLDGVERRRGEGEATRAEPLPGGLRVFVLSAKSTHLGCTVGFNAGLGASKDILDYDGDGRPDGRMLDPCHHGQWDVYRRGLPVPGTPTGEARMAALRIEVQPDGTLLGSGFDGPVGPQR